MYILGIRFQTVGKLYHFDASHLPDLIPGDFAIVETSRGVQLGQVILVVKDPQRPPDGAWKPVQRKATPRDLVLRQAWQQREAEALASCREKAKELNFLNVKFFAAEYSFDGSRLSFLYGLEEGDKVDLTSLKRVLQRAYHQSQVEMHQIGPRDVAKLLGGMGACGLAQRCCSTFLTDFSPISIKMAKEQGISLTPTEITGMCGRLRCCLVYEYEQYVEARKTLPKRNKRVMTPAGEGKVVDVFPLQQAVLVLLENGVTHTFPNSDLQPWDELQALQQKAQLPCPRHPEGGCNCQLLPAQAEANLPLEVEEQDDDQFMEFEGENLILSRPESRLAPEQTPSDKAASSPAERGKKPSTSRAAINKASVERPSAPRPPAPRPPRPRAERPAPPERTADHKPDRAARSDAAEGERPAPRRPNSPRQERLSKKGGTEPARGKVPKGPRRPPKPAAPKDDEPPES